MGGSEKLLLGGSEEGAPSDGCFSIGRQCEGGSASYSPQAGGSEKLLLWEQ